MSTAYEVRDAGVILRSGRISSPPTGYKVAFSSPAAQAFIGTSEPASGVLLVEDIRMTDSVFVLSELFSPIVEVEIAFRARRDIPARASVDEILASCDVTGALEFPDSRYSEWFSGRYPALTLQEVICDNCLTGLLVAGGHWRAADEIDLASVRAVLRLDGEVTREGSGTNVLGHPAKSVEWLSAHLAERGQVLRAGSIVSSGTLTETVPVRPSIVSATFDDVLGDVSVHALPAGS